MRSPAPTAGPTTSTDRHRGLRTTTAMLLEHVRECPNCLYNGLEYCVPVSGLLRAVKRASDAVAGGE